MTEGNQMKLGAKYRLAAELTKKQQKLDINGDGKIDADDLRKVREGQKPEKLAASTKSLAEIIRRKIAVEGTATSAIVTVGPASTFQYDWDGLEYDDSAVSLRPLEIVGAFLDLERVKPSRVVAVDKMGIEVIRFSVGGYSVILNLSAATVTVCQL
jgi:hypothetical protein